MGKEEISRLQALKMWLMVMGKDGASQLERQENKYRSAGISKRGTRHVVNNHKKKEDLDRTYSESTKPGKGWDGGDDRG